MIIKLDIFEWTSPQIFIPRLLLLFLCFWEYFQWEFPFTIINIYILDTLPSQYLQLIRFRRFYFLILLPSAFAHTQTLLLFESRFYLLSIASILRILLNCMYYLHKFYKEILKVVKWNWWTDFNGCFSGLNGFLLSFGDFMVCSVLRNFTPTCLLKSVTSFVHDPKQRVVHLLYSHFRALWFCKRPK